MSSLICIQAEVHHGNLQELRLEYEEGNVSFFFEPGCDLVLRESWDGSNSRAQPEQMISPEQAWRELTQQLDVDDRV